MSGTAVWWRSQEDILITGTMKTRMTSAGPQKVPALDVLNNFALRLGGSNRAKNDFYSLRFDTPRGFTILDSQGSRNALHINVRCRRSSCCGVPNSNFELRKQSLVHNIF